MCLPPYPFGFCAWLAGTFVGSAIRAESWYDGSDYPGPPLAEWSTVDSFSLSGLWTIRSLPDALQRQDSLPGLATSNAAHHTLLCGRCDDDECPTCLGRMRDVPAWSLPIALQLNGSADVVGAEPLGVGGCGFVVGTDISLWQRAV